MDSLDIVGLKEIAERLSVKQQTAAAWKHRGLLPEPEGTVSGMPAWRWSTIAYWAASTGRAGAVAEFTADASAWRVMDGAEVRIPAGIVVRQTSPPFPLQLPNGVVVNRIRFLATDGQWYELPHDDYLRGTGEASPDNVVKALLAGAVALIGIIVVSEATKGRPPV
jgi:hypothetical protein